MPAMTTRPIFATVLAVAALALAGCGSDAGSAPATLPPNVGLLVTAGPGIKFGATEYTAPAGTELVALQNNDTQRHTLLFVDTDNKTLPGKLDVTKSGSIDTREFSLEPGIYKMICDVPGHEAMKATLTVD